MKQRRFIAKVYNIYSNSLMLDRDKQHLKQSSSKEASIESINKQANQNKKCQTPSEFMLEYINAIGPLQQIGQLSRLKLSQCQKIVWTDKFLRCFKIIILETDFQSYSLLAHYGNYQMKISVIFVQVNSILLTQQSHERGSFGFINFVTFQEQQYAVKSVQFSETCHDSSLYQIYQEYFLCYIADCLAVGPKVKPLFGYDIIVTKNKAMFAMEKCDLVKRKKYHNLQKQMKNNLKILHSINFIHQDIKIANFAYSPFHKKHIFLDFGLSKFIIENLGEKTMTKFGGTLNYCSEQMRKCYTLNNYRLVDLYFNDLFALRKSIWAALRKLQISAEILQKQQFFQQSQQIIQVQREQIVITKETVFAFQLKHKLFNNNSIDQILKLLQKLSKMKKTLLQVLSSSKIKQNIVNNIEIKQKIYVMKNQLIKVNFKISQQDEQLNFLFDEENIGYNLMPIQQILSLDSNQFSQILKIQTWIYKLFKIFNPFSEKCQKNYSQQYLMKKKMIYKIYNSLENIRSSNKQQQQYEKEGQLFFVKSRTVLIFFFNQLKNWKNLHILLSLRMMFISIKDWIYVQKIEDIVLTIIQDPAMKIIKIVQFCLFWHELFSESDFDRRSMFVESIKKIDDLSHSSQIFLNKIIALSLRITTKDSSIFLDKNQKCEIQQMLQIVSKLSINTIYFQSIQNIQYLCLKIFRTKNLATLQQSHQDRLNLKIYLINLSFIQAYNLQDIQLKCYYQVFSPIGTQMSIKYAQKPCNILVENAINISFQMYEKRTELFLSKFWYPFHLVLINSKRHFHSIISRFAHISQQTNSVSQCLIFSKISFILGSMYLMDLNVRNAQQNQRLNKKQIYHLMDMLDVILNWVKQNYKQKMSSIKQKDTTAFIKIIQTKFILVLEGPTAPILQQKLYQIMQIISPLPCKNHKMIIIFLLLFNYYRDVIQNKRIHHYIHDMLILIAQKYIRSEQYILFIDCNNILGDVLQIYNCRHQYQRSLQILLKYIKNAQAYQAYLQPQNAIQLNIAISSFLKSLNNTILQQYYLKLLQNEKSDTSSWLLTYFRFSMFCQISKQLKHEQKIYQINKTALSLSKMTLYCATRIKPYLIKYTRELGLIKNKKKLYKFVRQEHRASDQKLPKYLKFVENKLKSIIKNNSTLSNKNTDCYQKYSKIVEYIRDKCYNLYRQ